MNPNLNVPLRERDRAAQDAAVWAATPDAQRVTLRALHRVETERALRSHRLHQRRTAKALA